MDPSRIFIFFIIICTDEDPGLRFESFAMANLRGAFTKFYFDSSVSFFLVMMVVIVLLIIVIVVVAAVPKPK